MILFRGCGRPPPCTDISRAMLSLSRCRSRSLAARSSRRSSVNTFSEFITVVNRGRGGRLRHQVADTLPPLYSVRKKKNDPSAQVGFSLPLSFKCDPAISNPERRGSKNNLAHHFLGHACVYFCEASNNYSAANKGFIYVKITYI